MSRRPSGSTSSPRRLFGGRPKRRRQSRFWPLLLVACAIAFASPFAADRLAGLSLAAVKLPELPRVIAGGHEVMPRSVAVRPANRPLQYRSMPTCSGGARAERGVTCLVDGDTGWEKGEKWRIAGIDTPELSKPECAAERRAAVAARDRMQTLMGGGYSLAGHGTDRYGRRLVTVRLSDGRDAGEVLVAEGLSQRWPNRGNPWCG
ncbi:MAG: thermonuclease family protein [Aurantimonas endophytica]|uniref:Endonuclease YncB(Thermonuclease family) n=1 Tax=Aurantimonas endophytica TaxID=1522175 RepID=A0A7W6HHC8_9HYPH|nr:endonuclease YncB(thermonuclease family) [Aurantimonas endophytica]MCO6406125.1 hypothetical protein [Aurantimonas endophytica]